MARYLIETPHNDKNCHLLVNQLYGMGCPHNFDWGCEEGSHCGWAIIEADDQAQAALVVPSIARSEARTVRIVKYNPEQAGELHIG